MAGVTTTVIQEGAVVLVVVGFEVLTDEFFQSILMFVPIYNWPHFHRYHFKSGVDLKSHMFVSFFKLQVCT